MPTISISLLWVTKSLLAIILYNTVIIAMAATNETRCLGKYLVWTAQNAGEFLWADKVEFSKEVAMFFRGPKVVKSYALSDFLKYNVKNIEPLETK
jgi:hypothetical protein